MEKLLLTVWEAADVLSVSRSRVYELLYAEQPVWTGAGYCDPDTGFMLPTGRQALDHLDADPDAGPVHVLRFGTHHDIAGMRFEPFERYVTSTSFHPCALPET